MTEFNITAESKETIKELIKEYNVKILQKSIKDYIAEEKPSMEDLVETLSNHVFLDRKPNGDIGIINDFIFGLLVGENLISGKYDKYYPNITSILPQDFALKAIQVFKVQDKVRKKKLWDVFNKKEFPYDINFYFNLDYSYLKEFNRGYNNLYVNDTVFENLSFTTSASFKDCGFSNITFNNCSFDLDIFESCSFHNCDFYGCSHSNGSNREFNDFAVFACNSDNQFIKELSDKLEEESIYRDEGLKLTEIFVLSQFFGIANLKPKAKKLSQIKSHLAKYPTKELSKIISNLKSNEYIFFKDDVGFVSKKGINYFNQNKTQL